MAEIKKRQSEAKGGKTPAQTLGRYKKEAEAERAKMKGKVDQLGPDEGKAYREKKAKERAKELKVLLAKLKKMDLTIVGVEGADVATSKPGGDRAEEGEEVSDSGSGTGESKSWGFWFKRGEKKPKVIKEKKESLPLGERLKRAIIPVPLSSVSATNGITRESARREAAMLQMPTMGVGWEMAQDPQAGAGLAKSANNAENLAAKMKAGS